MFTRAVRSVALAVLLAISLSFGVAVTPVMAAQVGLKVSSDLNLSQPKVALLKFVSLFMSGSLNLFDDSLLTVAVTNPNQGDVAGPIRLALAFGGKELGFVETVPITVSPGTSTWSVRSGGSGDNIVVDATHSSGGRINSTWRAADWGGDESWVKENIFDWTSTGNAADILTQIRAVEIPPGSYSMEVSFDYKDPQNGSARTAKDTITWSVAPSQPVRLIAPDKTSHLFPKDGIPAGDLEFTWELPDLPSGVQTTSILTVTDDVTHGKAAEIEISHEDGYGQPYTYIMDSHELRTGRSYTWSLKFVNAQTGQTIGAKIPTATFWLQNQPPTITRFDASDSKLRAGDSASFSVEYADDGDRRRDLKVAWYVDDALKSQNRDRFDVTFPPRTSADGEVRERTVRVEVTDSFGATAERSHTVAVQANRPPVFEIDEPDDSLVKLGSRMTLGLTASGVSDPDDDIVTRLEWYENGGSSSGDGVRIGTGETVDFRLDNEGERRITVVAEDSRGGVSRRSIDITVAANQPPVVSILDLTENMQLVQGTAVDLAANVSDDFDDDLVAHFDVNGNAVPQGQAFSFDDPGSYLVRAWATDSDNLRGEASVLLTVSGSFNPAPRVAIAGCVDCSDVPADSEFKESGSNVSMREGQAVKVFATVGGDADNVTWELDGRTVRASDPGVALDTVGGTYRLGLSGLILGNHNVVVSAEKDGAVGAARSRVEVRPNHSPTVEVRGLAAKYTEGDAIRFGVEAADPDKDELQSFSWKLTAPDGTTTDGDTQGDIVVESAILGTYTFQARAVDVLGGESTQKASIHVAANRAPSVVILEPQPGAVVEKGKPVAVRLQTEDPDGDAVETFRINGREVQAEPSGDNEVALSQTLNESGPLTLEIVGVDSRGGISSQATVSIMVIDRASAESTLSSLEILPLTTGDEESLTFGARRTLQASVITTGGAPPMVTWVVAGKTVGTVMAAPFEVEHVFAKEGEVKVEAIAVDQGGHTLRAERTVAVAPNGPPHISIKAPLSGTELATDQVVDLQAEVSDPEGHAVEVAWYLDGADAPFTSGVTANMTLSEAGEHRLTARATDAFNAVGEHTVTLLARPSEGQALLPRIVQPQENQLVTAGQEIEFTAADVPAGAKLIWQSKVQINDVDSKTVIIGEATRGADDGPGELSLSAALNDPGDHTISLLVQYDADGPVTVADTRSIIANRQEESEAGNANQGPGPKVASVLSVTTKNGVEVSLVGGGTDPELTSISSGGAILRQNHVLTLEPGEAVQVLFYSGDMKNAQASGNETLRITVGDWTVAEETSGGSQGPGRTSPPGGPPTVPPVERDADPLSNATGSIGLLLDAGLIKPEQRGRVNPSVPMNWGESAAVIARLLGIVGDSASSEEAFASMKMAGLVVGNVSAGSPMRRLGLAKMLARALGITPSSGTFPFNDGAGLSQEDRGILTELNDRGVMKGFPDKTFHPNQVVTLGELANIVERLLGRM